MVDPERDLSFVVRISELDASKAIVVPLKVGERMLVCTDTASRLMSS